MCVPQFLPDGRHLGKSGKAVQGLPMETGFPSKLFRNPRVSLGKGGFQIDLSHQNITLSDVILTLRGTDKLSFDPVVSIFPFRSARASPHLVKVHVDHRHRR